VVVGYFEVPNKSTHTRNAITAVADTMTRNPNIPAAMPIQYLIASLSRRAVKPLIVVRTPLRKDL
jgi:hypothetical protein